MTPICRALLALMTFLAVSGQPAVSQAVAGELRDQDQGRLLPGARLFLLSDAGIAVDSTLTDRMARFRLTAPAAGMYTVALRLDGWASVMSEPVRLTTNAVTELDWRPPLVASAAIREMSDIIGMEARLQESLPEICGEPFRAWEAGLLIGVVRLRSTREPVPGAAVQVASGDVVARSTISSDSGVYVLCNVPVGDAVRITVQAPGAAAETTDVEIRAGTLSWYDLPVGPRRR